MTALQSKQDFARLLDSYDTFLFDCDGVIWNGPTGSDLTPHIGEAIECLRQHGKQIAFITNNATLSRQDYVEKFKRLGIRNVERKDIFTSGSASALHIKRHIVPTLPADRNGIYVIGQAGLEQELRDCQLEWKGGSDPEDDVLMPYQDFSSIVPDPSISIVLFSFQMHINYKQYSKAYNYLASNKDCQLILTNDDSTVLVPDGVCPGEGALAAVLLPALGKKRSPLIVGKPHQPLLDIVHETLQFDPARTIMVGDRLETDILFGKRGGIATLLVWTGSSNHADLERTKEQDRPDYTADYFGQILKGLDTYDALTNGHDAGKHRNGRPFLERSGSVSYPN